MEVGKTSAEKDMMPHLEPFAGFITMRGNRATGYITRK